MKETRDVVQHIPEEENDYYSDDDLFSISSWGADLSFREIVDRYNQDELVKPEMQRKYVWDKTEASRFIDSLLLGLPVPSIFLAKTGEEKMLIVDGYQRIMTVRDFTRGIFSTDGKVFRLSRSNRINSRWRGKAFSELSDVEQRKIRNTTIHAIIFVQDRPPGRDTSLFQIFERINTSGRTLMPQEIRNCVYQGELNKLLLRLNLDPTWRGLYGLPDEDSRMRDVEFILRFFALKSPTFDAVEQERISLKKFLNDYMRDNRNPSEETLLAMEERFLKVMKWLDGKCGRQVFHNLSSTNPDKLVVKFNPTVFDSIAIATDKFMSRTADADQPQTVGLSSDGLVKGPSAELFEDRRRDLLRDEAYKSAISKETMRTESIRTRVRLALRYLYGLKDAEQ